VSKYILRRLPQAIPTVIFITMLVFALTHMAPGDPIDLLVLTNPEITAEEIQRLKALYGLDQPIYVQYLKWLGQIVQGNLGYSRLHHQAIIDVLVPRIGNTLVLTGLSLIISLLVAVPVGIFSALRQYSRLDYLLSLLAVAGMSLPIFWFALVLMLIFSVYLGWLPPGGHYSLEPDADLIGQARYLIMPVTVLSLFQIATWMRFTRSAMLEVIAQEYIVTARSKGLLEREVMLRHALRNALIPIVTLVALSIPGLISGAVITETIFSWPGMGRLIFDSLMNKDYNLTMGIFLLFGILVVAFNLVADVLYAIVDPRIRYD
jgi:peptide/nickel transport system permease protein